MQLRIVCAALILLAPLTASEVLACQKKGVEKTDGRASRGKTKSMFLGLRTVVYRVSNLKEAKSWYSRVLGIEPYFDQPFYVGFNVGGFELGLQPSESGGESKPGGVAAYWGVENIEASFKRLLDLGATKHGDVQDVGGGIRVATVTDPFGNIFGIIENPHFKIEGKR